MENPYPQRTALIGFVPIIAMMAGVGVGGGVAILLGASEFVGALPGAVAGFVASRWALRRSFSRHLS